MFSLLFFLLLVFISSLLLLLTVAFFTLFERKVMGSFHLRLGPTKVTFVGILQPLLDALKLFSKMSFTPVISSKLVYSIIPVLSLFLSILIMFIFPLSVCGLSNSFSMFAFMTLSAVSVFSVLLSGWSSNSKYSLMGSLRSIAQSISYESVFNTLIILLMSLYFSYSIHFISMNSSFINLFLVVLWFISFLAETHRAPFDFSEAESELVSGFNTEYSGMSFSLLFLSEYIMILFGCLLMSCFYFFPVYFSYFSSIMVVLGGLLFSFIVIWVRITYCRYRYDFLMSLAWKDLLPISLFMFILLFLLMFL